MSDPIKYPNFTLEITEEDGSPSTYPFKLKFPNSAVVDNGDGTTSIDWTVPLDLRYLKLDQTTPQTVINGAPTFNAGLISGTYGNKLTNGYALRNFDGDPFVFVAMDTGDTTNTLYINDAGGGMVFGTTGIIHQNGWWGVGDIATLYGMSGTLGVGDFVALHNVITPQVYTSKKSYTVSATGWYMIALHSTGATNDDFISDMQLDVYDDNFGAGVSGTYLMKLVDNTDDNSNLEILSGGDRSGGGSGHAITQVNVYPGAGTSAIYFYVNNLLSDYGTTAKFDVYVTGNSIPTLIDPILMGSAGADGVDPNYPLNSPPSANTFTLYQFAFFNRTILSNDVTAGNDDNATGYWLRAGVSVQADTPYLALYGKDDGSAGATFLNSYQGGIHFTNSIAEIGKFDSSRNFVMGFTGNASTKIDAFGNITANFIPMTGATPAIYVEIATQGINDGSIADGEYWYNITAVNSLGETGIGSPANVTVTGGGGSGSVNLTLNGNPSSYPDITELKVYRSKKDAGAPPYYLLATLSPSATSYHDTTADASLGAQKTDFTNKTGGNVYATNNLYVGGAGIDSAVNQGEIWFMETSDMPQYQKCMWITTGAGSLLNIRVPNNTTEGSMSLFSNMGVWIYNDQSPNTQYAALKPPSWGDSEINNTLHSGADNTYDLGSSTYKYRNIYANGLNAVSVDDEAVFVNDQMVFA